MSDRKRSGALWFLTIFFVWAALKSLGNLLMAENVADHAILVAVGAGWLYFALNVPVLAGETAMAWLLAKRRQAAVRLAPLVIALEFGSTALVTLLTMCNVDIAKAAYAADRAARGLSVHADRFDVIFSPAALWGGLLAYVAFYAVVYVLLRRVRGELPAATG